MAPRGAIPARCMDQATPRTSTLAPLAAFVEELRRTERFQELVRTLPTRARVSEPVLPLVLAALHAELRRAGRCRRRLVVRGRRAGRVPSEQGRHPRVGTGPAAASRR